MSQVPAPAIEPASDLFVKVLTGHRQWLSVKGICARLKSAGFDAVLAGGCVRDGLLGVPPKDFDVATNATPDQVEALFPKTVAIGKNFGVIVVPIDEGGAIEIATFRRDGDYHDGRRPAGVAFADREEDAARRDFTVNALFYDPATNQILDSVGGRSDLAKKILRVVGDPRRRFQEDKLRILRAVRFAGQLDFQIEAATEAAIRDFASQLHVVSRERIRDEVDKLLMAPHAARGFSALARLSLGEVVFGDWATRLLPPGEKVFAPEPLDLKRAFLFLPVLRNIAPERIQERLQAWKYGRAFIDFILWFIKFEASLRVPSPDPIRILQPRDQVVDSFRAFANKSRGYTPNETDWMTALELWTDERSVKACALLDLEKGRDQARDQALVRRGLTLGKPDGSRAKADDLPGFHGADLGRELKKLNREILLLTVRADQRI